MLFSSACRNSTKFLGLANAFSGGIFIGIGLFHLLPEGSEKFEGVSILGEYPCAYFMAFGSYSLILFIEKVAFNSHALIIHDHEHGHGHEHHHHEHEEIKNTGLLPPVDIHEIENQEQLVPNNEGEPKKPTEDETEQAVKNVISSSGRLASFLFLRNSMINDDGEKPKDPVLAQTSKLINKIENGDKQEDLFVNPNNIDNKETQKEDNKETNVDAHHHNEHHQNTSSFTPYVLLIALGFHGFFEGLALGLQKSIQGTIFLLVAILAHKWAEALTLGISFVKAGTRKNQIIAFCCVFSIIGPLGVLTGFFLAAASEVVEGIFLSLSTGTFLYVACSEVIVEEFAVSKYKYPKYFLYLLGAIFTAVLAIIEHLGEHEEH